MSTLEGNIEVVIRRATQDDIPALCRLYFDFHEFHAAGIPDRLNSLGPWEEFDASQLTRSLEQILTDQKAGLYVAEAGDTLAGFVEIYLREDEPDPAIVPYRYAHLQSLMVAFTWRKQGLGKRLVYAAETWAKELGAYELRLDTWEFPGSPAEFYEKLGFRTLKRKWVNKF